MTIHNTFNSSYLFEKDHICNWAYQTQLFTKDECQSIINYGNSCQKQLGFIDNGILNQEIRETKVVWIYPNSETIAIFDRLSEAIKSLNNDYFKFDLLGFIEGLQFTEYEAPSGHYQSHIDQMYNGTIRKLSIVLQLSDPQDYEGGNLQIFTSKNPQILSKEQGTLLAFPSYALHQVTPITKGKRYSLVAWITGPNFK